MKVSDGETKVRVKESGRKIVEEGKGIKVRKRYKKAVG